jgi:hypothetical protein
MSTKYEPDGMMHKHRTSKGSIHGGGSDRSHGHDGHAHATHKEHNKEHGTGFNCEEDEYGGGSGQKGGAGMASNYHHENDKTPKTAKD